MENAQNWLQFGEIHVSGCEQLSFSALLTKVMYIHVRYAWIHISLLVFGFWHHLIYHISQELPSDLWIIKKRWALDVPLNKSSNQINVNCLVLSSPCVSVCPNSVVQVALSWRMGASWRLHLSSSCIFACYTSAGP